jgi:hypothetical protein
VRYRRFAADDVAAENATPHQQIYAKDGIGVNAVKIGAERFGAC